MTFTFQRAEGLGSLASLALMDWGHGISRCLLCQQKGAVLEPGCGPVPQFTDVSKLAVSLVRTSPPMGGQVGQGWARGCERSSRTYRIQSRKEVVTNN